MRILVVEDEKKVASFIKKGLQQEGYAVDLAYDGQEALQSGMAFDYDLIVLDLMLPKRLGLDVLRELRSKKPGVKVLVLTAKGAIEDKVAGLDAGADDYLIKPFAFAELSARIRALLRRGTQ
jgi:DNA-binding response OmpR family regulator